jgi:hypothetical protein
MHGGGGRGVKVPQNYVYNYKDLLKKLIFLENKKDFISLFF